MPLLFQPRPSTLRAPRHQIIFQTIVPSSIGNQVPKPNYGFQKRQKELAKQQKREAKAQRRKDRAAAENAPPAQPEPPQTDPSADLP